MAGAGASLAWNSVGISNQSTFQIRWYRYVRQPVFGISANKTAELAGQQEGRSRSSGKDVWDLQWNALTIPRSASTLR